MRPGANGGLDMGFDPVSYLLGKQAGGGGGGGTSNFTLIGETVLENLSEWTDTANADQIDTGINISNTDYAWGIIVVTCDSPITTSDEWGMSFMLFGRYLTSGNVYNPQYLQQKGSSTLSREAMVGSAAWANNYGVYAVANKPNVLLERKCSSAIPKIRSGNYTVKVYALTSL